MGKIAKYLTLLCGLFMVTSLYGKEVRRPLFSPVEVRFRLLQAPRIKAGSVSSVNRGSLQLVNRRWGVVEITYRPRFDFDGKGSSRSRALPYSVWLDDVICGVRVILCDRQNRKNPALALFSTRVEFWTIPLDWIDHKYFVYVPPMLIERVMPPRRSESRGAKTAAVNDFIVCVTFFHKKWGVLGEGYWGLKGRGAAEDFRELARLVPQTSVFHGALLSRSRSPWGLNDLDHFDLEKPAYIPAPLDEAAIEKAASAAVAEEAAFVESSRKKSSSSANGKRKNRRTKR